MSIYVKYRQFRRDTSEFRLSRGARETRETSLSANRQVQRNKSRWYV